MSLLVFKWSYIYGLILYVPVVAGAFWLVKQYYVTGGRQGLSKSLLSTVGTMIYVAEGMLLSSLTGETISPLQISGVGLFVAGTIMIYFGDKDIDKLT